MSLSEKISSALSRIIPPTAPTELASGIAFRELSLDQLGGVAGGIETEHTCTTCSNGAADDCGGGAE